MKRMISAVLGIFLAIIIPVFSFADTGQNKIRNIFLFNENQILEGLYGSSSYYFDIPDISKVLPESYIELHFSHSALQNNHDSNLTILLNDTPLQSVLLTQANEEDGCVKAYLKSQYLINGFNKITFSTMQSISSHPNPSRFSPANWLLIQKESLLHLEMQPLSQPLLLSSYSELFTKNGNEQADDVDDVIVLPDHPSDKTINAALLLAANLGQLYHGQIVKPQIIFYNNISAVQKQQNLVLVAPLRSPISKEWKLQDNKLLPGKQVLLKLTVSPWNNQKKLLFVSGTTDAAVLQAARLLCEPQLTKELVTSSYADNIQAPQFGYAGALGDREQISLADLQMQDLRYEGVYTQRVTFSVLRPGSQKLNDGAYFEIHFTHSEAIDYDKSVMTIYLNGTPLRSIGLNSDNAENGIIRVHIPQEFHNLSAFNFTINFFLNLNNVDSFGQFSENAWAEVKNSSYLFLPHQRSLDLNLNRFPDLFNERGSLEDLLLVLPDNPSEQDLASAGALLGVMSSNTEGPSIFETVCASKISKVQQKRI